MAPHPLDILSVDETNVARDIVLSLHQDVVLDFREIYLQESAKDELRKFLQFEHSGRLSSTSSRPARLAKCQYDIIGADKVPSYHESVVDVVQKKRVKHQVVGKEHHACLTV